jgi:gliding motility-associated-like protein
MFDAVAYVQGRLRADRGCWYDTFRMPGKQRENRSEALPEHTDRPPTYSCHMAEHIPAGIISGKQGRTILGSVLSLFRKAVLVIAPLLLWQGEAHATHALGGELSYECLGNSQYRVTLNFYRDCNGVAAPTNCNNGLLFHVRSTQCVGNFDMCFSPNPTIEIITPICPSETDRCISANGTYGVEKYTYTAIVDLLPYAGCGGTDWIFYWSICCRNNAITSLNDPGNRELYLDAKLNNTAGLCNSSPTFTNSPAAYYCLGEQINYNPGAVDADGDSLAYALIQARTTNGTPIPYQPNYSFAQPIRNAGGANAVTLNPQTGTVTVTPNVLQVSVVTYQVKEYRNGVLVGEITRDVQFVIRPCTGNSPPVATGVNGTNAYTLQVCAGAPVSFTVNSSDPNAGQAVSMNWNGGIPGANFTTSGSPFPTGTFTWTPTVADIGNNTFTVHVQDNGCPIIASNDYGYTIQVTPPSTPANAGADLSVCGTVATLAGVLPFPQVQGTWTVINGTGTFANNHSPTTTVSGLSQGVNTFQWSVNYLTCGTQTDQVQVTSFNPAQPAAAAGPDQQLCLPTNTATLAGNTAVSPATGVWSVITGTGTFANPNSPTTNVNGLGIGQNRFRWTINNGPCGTPTQDEVVITVYNNNQAAASAGPDISICTPASSVTMNANAAVTPASGAWTLVSGGGVITNPASRNTTITGLTVGVHVFRWTISNGPCTPGTTLDEVSIYVYDANSPSANAGADQQVCSPGTATLTGSVPVFPATGQWTLVNGNGTITSPTSPTTTITSLSIGTSTFQWTVNNGPCANGVTNDQVVVVTFDPTVSGANAGPDQSYCTPNTSTTLAANAPPTPAQGTWTLVSGTGSIASIHSANSTVSGLTVGENKFRWTINNGPCPVNPPSDEVSIFIYDAGAPGANAGPDQQLCTPATSTTLAGNNAVFPGTGQWSVVAGTGTFVNATNPGTSVSGLSVGVNTFRWSLNNGPCANPLTQDEVSIIVFNAANPVANAGPDQDLCTPTLTATLSGSSLIVPATGTWTLISGSGTIVSPNSPTTQITGLAVGDNIFRWSVSNGPCANSNTQDQVRIRVFDQNNPVANAGPDKELCSGSNTTTMAGSSLIYPATGTWTLVNGSGLITTPGSPTTTITGMGVGVNTFQWTVSNGPCNNSLTNDQVSITVFQNTHPPVTATGNASICVPTSPNLVTVTGSTPVSPASGVWTLVSGSGTITSPNTPITTITGMSVGTNVFQWTVTNGPCTFPNNSAQVTILVFDAAQLPANAGPDQSLCTPITSTNLQGSALIPPGSGAWTLVSGSGTITTPGSPTSGVTGLALGANVFRWTVANGPCSANTNDLVTIFVFNGSAQQANAGPDQQLCNTNATTTLAANAAIAPATGSWSVQQGTAIFGNATSATTSVSNLAVGVNILVWSLNNGACGTSSDQVAITVYDNANPAANAGPDQQLCTPVTSTTLTGSNLLSPATGQWTLISGSGNIVTPTSSTTQVNSLGTGNNVFRWTVFNGPCLNGNGFDEVTISVFSGNAQTANAGPDLDLCTPASSTPLSANSAQAPAQGTWTGPAGVTFGNIHGPNTTVSGLQVGDNILTWSINNGSCGTSTDQVNIRVFSAANPVANAGPDQDLCTPQVSATMAGSNVIYPATGTWTLVSGTGTITNPTMPNTTITAMAVGPNVFRWTVSNGPCANSLTMDDVVITVYDHNVSGSNAGPDQELCTPQNFTNMAASAAPAPAQGTWTVISGGGTIGNIHDPNTAITGIPVGANVFQWSVSNGACPVNPPNDQVTILVYDSNNPVANAGPDQSLCTPNLSTTLAGSNVIFPATGTWTLVSGGGVFLNANSPTTAVSGLMLGENKFRWTVNNGPCTNPLTQDEVSVFVFDQFSPDANAGPDQSICTPQLNTTLAGNAPIAPAVGTWVQAQGTGVITDLHNPTTTVTGLAIGVNIFIWSVNNGPCANGVTNDAVTITVYDNNLPNPDAGPDQDLCLPSTAVTLAGSAATSPAVGTWTIVTGGGTFVDIHSPSTSVSNIPVGVNTYRWTVANGVCSNNFDEVTIRVFSNLNPVANAGPDQDICTPDSTVTMAGSNVIVPATGTWTIISGSGVISNPSLPNTAVVDLEVGTTVLVWTVSNGPCANGITTDTMVVRVYDRLNPVAAAGPDVQLCTPAGPITMAGSLVTAPAVGTWTVTQGTAVFSDINAPNAVVTGLSVGLNILRWTVNNGPCESGISFDEISITLFDINNPVANAGPDQHVCGANSTATMAGSNLIGPATGTWTLVFGTGVITNASSPTTTITGLGVGENIFQWEVSNGPCGPVTQDVVSIYTHDSGNPIANAGADQQICTPATGTTLAGSNVIFPATGIWSLVSGQGTITNPTAPNSTVTNLGFGENIFEWRVDNTPCVPGVTTDQVSIFLFNLNAPPAAAGLDQDFCDPAGTVQLAGNTPTVPAIGVWSSSAPGVVFADVNNPNTTVTGFIIGETDLTWTINNGVCGITSDIASIRVFDPNNLDANAGLDQEYCTPQDSTYMEGNTPTFPATGEWTLVNGAGLFADPTDPGSKVVGLSIGVNTFVWTTDNGPCPDAITMDTVNITIFSDSTAAAYAGEDFETCLPLTTVQLGADTPQPPATGMWSILSGAGYLVDPNDPATVLDSLEVGITTLLWTLDNGPCPNNGILVDTLVVTVYDPFGPTANAGPDISLCTPEDSTIMAGNLPLFPAYGTWHLVSGTGVIADTNYHATAITGLTIGINVFTWTVYNGDCGFAPPTIDTVQVLLYDETAPLADAGADQALCSTSSTSVTMAGNAATHPGVGTWTSLDGTGTIADANDPLTEVSDLPVGIHPFVWTIFNGPCGTSTDTMTVNVFDGTITSTDAGLDQELCTPEDSAQLAATAPVVPATGTWSILSGSGTFSDANASDATISGLGNGLNQLLWTIDNGPCGVLTDTVSITLFDGGLTSASAGPDQELCGPLQQVTMAATAVTAPAIGVWTIVSGPGVISDVNDPLAVLSGLSSGVTVLAWGIDNGPCVGEPLSDTVVVTIYDGVAQAADAGPDQQFCDAGPVDADMFANEAILPAIGTWTAGAGTGVITDPSNRNTTITGIDFGTSTFTWTIDNGVCGTTSDEVAISLYDINVPSADGGPDQRICEDTTYTQFAAVPATSTATGHWELIQGSGVLNDATLADAQVTDLLPGDNVFVWVLENGACGTTMDTVVVNLHDCSTLVVPDSYSPNGDGVNDTYVIGGIEYYPENTFKVFNRWGSVVYERSPYNNTWDGKSEGKLNWGTELPESTYYFILDPGKDKEVITGYIYLRR